MIKPLQTIRAVRVFGVYSGAILPVIAALGDQPDTLKHTFLAPPVGAEVDTNYGGSFAMNESFIAAGGYGVFGSPNPGVIKVFDAASGSLLHTLVSPIRPRDAFGGAVALSGTRLVAGAGQSDRAYIYELDGPTPTVPVLTLVNPHPESGATFGWTVAISGTRVVIGADGDSHDGFQTGRAYLYDLESATPAVPVAILKNPTRGSQEYFGAALGLSGARLVVGGGHNSRRVYVYALDGATPTVPVFTLTSSVQNPIAFGSSVAISGSRVLVGASGARVAGAIAGSVYVYDLEGATPQTPVRTLGNPSPSDGDEFGSSLGIDGTRVVVGASNDDARASNSGRAYVYDLAGATPGTPVATLNHQTPKADNLFGSDVAVVGARVIVGAVGDDAFATNSGGAYVYDILSDTPTDPVLSLDTRNPASGDLFGFTTALSGSLLAVGAVQEDTGASNAGSAYVYDLCGAAPAETVIALNNPSPAVNDRFGTSVAISGPQVVVGAPQDDTGASDAGSAYVYDLSSSMPSTPRIVLNNPNPAASDRFASSVAISAMRVVAGAPQDDEGAIDAGSVFVYDLASATPAAPAITLHHPNPAATNRFGSAVATSGSHVAVACPLDDTGANDAGRVFIFDISSNTPTLPAVTFHNPSPATSDRFGTSVAISGSRVVVGTPDDDTGATDAGVAYLFDLSSATPSAPIFTLNNPSSAANDRFGSSVAISGSRVVIGAYQDDVDATDTGSVYVFDLASATPAVPVATLSNPSPTRIDNFGISVAIDGVTVAIGESGDDAVATDKGAAHVFRPSNNDTDGDGLLDLWEYARFGSVTSQTAVDDPDRNGRSALLDLAFDSDPIVPSGAGPLPHIEGDFLVLEFPKRAGVRYSVESAPSPATGDFSSATTTVLLDSATTLKVRDNFPIAQGGARFMRVHVTASP